MDPNSFAFGFIAAGMPVGATLSCPFAGILQDVFGRRITLIIAAVFYIAAVSVSSTAHGYSQLVAGRVLTGMAIGVFSSTAPMFISELSPPSMRGRLGAVNQMCICIGIMVGYISCKVLGSDWRWQFMAGAPVAMLLAAAFIFITPFSPRWLLTKGREAEARVILERIRGPEAVAAGAVDDEVSAISASLSLVGSVSTWAQLKQRHVMWSICIGVTLAFIQQWCGCNAVNAYAPDILQQSGFSAASSSTQSIMIGLSKVIFVSFALVVMDRVGRRPLLIYGTLLLIVFLILCAVFMLPTVRVPPELTAVALFLYMAAFELSLGPLLWLLLSELYPLSIRGIAMAVGSTANWFFTVTVTLLYPPLKNAMGETSDVFFLFAGICVGAVVWIWAYIPETRGKSLEEIETMLKEGRTDKT